MSLLVPYSLKSTVLVVPPVHTTHYHHACTCVLCGPAANERTFLGWLSMAVTIGSVSAALVGFTASEKDARCAHSSLRPP